MNPRIPVLEAGALERRLCGKVRVGGPVAEGFSVGRGYSFFIESMTIISSTLNGCIPNTFTLSSICSCH